MPWCKQKLSLLPYKKKWNRFKLFSFYSHHEKQHRYELFCKKQSYKQDWASLAGDQCCIWPQWWERVTHLTGNIKRTKRTKKTRLSLQNLYKSYIKKHFYKKLFWSLWVASLCICTFHPDTGVEGFWLAGVSTQPAITCWCLLIEVDGPVHCVCGLGSFLKNV